MKKIIIIILLLSIVFISGCLDKIDKTCSNECVQKENEVLFKIICHNIAVLNEALLTFDIYPIFYN